MARVRTAEYWDKRAIARSGEIDAHLDATSPKLARIYNDAYRRIQGDIETIYKNYAKDTGVDVAELKKLLSRSETDRFFKTLEGVESKQYIRENYKARISRLEQMKLQLHGTVKQIYGGEVKLAALTHATTIKRTQLRTAYDIEQGTRVGGAFTSLNKRRLDAMLQSKWQGDNYSSRIWKNTDAFAGKISEMIPAGLLAGQSPERLSREVREQFGVKKYEADRLIRTETTYFEGQAEMSLYDELGIDQYVYVAVLDSRTSIICGEMDGKIFKTVDAVVGDNFPPLHVFCRSKTRAYLGADYEPTVRRVRDQSQADPDAPKSYIVPYQNYADWAKERAPDYSKLVPTIPAAGVPPIATPQLTTIKNAPDEIINSVQDGMTDVAQQYPAAYTHVDNTYIAPYKTADQLHTLGEFSHGVKPKSSELVDRNGVKMQRLTFDKVDTGISILLHKYNRLPEQFAQVAAKNAAKKFTVATSVKGYVYHESGHALDFTMSLADKKLTSFYEQVHKVSGTKRGLIVPVGDKRLAQMNAVISKESINPALLKTYQELGLKTSADRNKYLRANVGKYAAKSNQEAFGELFTGVVQGSDLPIVKIFKRHLDSELNRLGLN